MLEEFLELQRSEDTIGVTRREFLGVMWTNEDLGKICGQYGLLKPDNPLRSGVAPEREVYAKTYFCREKGWVLIDAQKNWFSLVVKPYEVCDILKNRVAQGLEDMGLFKPERSVFDDKTLGRATPEDVSLEVFLDGGFYDKQ